MENFYKKMSDDDLLYIYNDIIESDNMPKRVESLVPYAEEIKKKLAVTSL